MAKTLQMDNLLSLINTLSPAEKQHFKKRNNPKADFVLLFDYINKKKSCITSEVLPYLSKKLKGKKAFNSSYLSVAKNYLKNRILESLRAQYIHKKRNHELLSGAMNIDILMERGLFSFAKSEIDAMTEKNFESNFPIERLLILRRKSVIHYHENFENTSIIEIESLFKSNLDTAEQILLTMKFARALSIMTFQNLNGIIDFDILNSFMDEPFMKDESMLEDFVHKYLFHWIRAQYEEFKNNAEGAMKHFNRAIKLWLNNPNYIEAYPFYFRECCGTYFKYLIYQKDPFSNQLDDINHDELIKKLNTGSLSQFEREQNKLIIILFEILDLRRQLKWKEIIKLISSNIKDENLSKISSIYERVVFCYYFALAHFENGNLDKSENILFDFLNPLDKRLVSNPIYISVFILLHVVILLEKENEKHLRHLLPKYKQYLKQAKRLGDFEIQFFTMASQLISTRFKSNPDLVYKRFLERLIAAQKSDQKGIEIEYDYFVSWVKKKELL